MRNYGRQAKQHGPSVVLTAQGRIAKYGKRPIVAKVDLGYAEYKSIGIYRHPEIQFRSPDSDGECVGGLRVDMRFQSHVVNSTDFPDIGRIRSRGFLRPDHLLWMGTYAGEIRAEFRYPGHGEDILRVIRLVNRARKRAPRRDVCQLLSLLVGLRRCGVEIHVWSNYLDTQRSYRRPAEPIESLAHAA